MRRDARRAPVADTDSLSHAGHVRECQHVIALPTTRAVSHDERAPTKARVGPSERALATTYQRRAPAPGGVYP